LPSANINKNESLRILFWLVLTGNVYFFVVLEILWALYYFGVYNPWCSKVWHKLLIPENVMSNLQYCVLALFASATLPVTLGYGLKKFK